MFTNVDYVNTLANGFKAELDTKQSKKDVVQPDWNQNDEKAADYVKNRPFGEIFSDTLTWDGDTTGREVALNQFIKVSDATPTANDLSNGFSIIFGGETWEVSAEETTNFITDIGEAVFIQNVLGSSVPFVLIFLQEVTGTTKGTYFLDFRGNAPGQFTSSFTINGYNGFSIVDKIDEKFIPDTIQRTITGTVGQMVGFDENGNAIATDRTHYAENQTISIDWDGNTEGRVCFDGYTYKVSDVILTPDSVSNGISFNVCANDGTISSMFMSGDEAKQYFREDNAFLAEPFVSIPTPNYVINSNFTAPEAGTYFIKNDNVYISSLVANGMKYHTIDKKFLPEDCQTKLTGTKGQIVGFNTYGNAVAQDFPESESNIFFAIYGETTFSETKAAYDAGKYVVCQINHRDTRFCNLSSVSATTIVFDEMTFDGRYLQVYVSSDNSWESTIVKSVPSAHKATHAIGGDDALLPSDIGAIPAPAAAEVGQFLSVKAVDTNGAPTEWEAVDQNIPSSAVEQYADTDIEFRGVLSTEDAFIGWEYVSEDGTSYCTRLYRSVNGINWTLQHTFDAGINFSAILWNNDEKCLVAIGRSACYVSTDKDIGIEWVEKTAHPTLYYQGRVQYAYGNGIYLVIDNREAYCSTDLMTWTQSDHGLGGYYQPRASLAYGNGKFVAAYNGIVSVTTDGINWTTTNVSGISTGPLVTFDGTSFWIYSNQSIYKTDNGITFEIYDCSVLIHGWNSNNWAYNNGTLIMIPDGGSQTYYVTNDFINLKTCTVPSDPALRFVCSGKSKFVIVSYDGTVCVINLKNKHANTHKSDGLDPLTPADIGAQEVLVGTEGQIVSFDADGNAVAVDAPTVDTINAIPVPATAEVGQLLSVLAVDENGIPTEWAVIDPPSGLPEGAEVGDILTMTDDGLVWQAPNITEEAKTYATNAATSATSAETYAQNAAVSEANANSSSNTAREASVTATEQASLAQQYAASASAASGIPDGGVVGDVLTMTDVGSAWIEPKGWKTVLEEFWETPSITPLSFDAETNYFTCAAEDIADIEVGAYVHVFVNINKSCTDRTQLVVNGNLIIKSIRVVKVDDTTFYLSTNGTDVFVPTNASTMNLSMFCFDRHKYIDITDISTKKARLTLSGKFAVPLTKYEQVGFYGTHGNTYSQMNVSYVNATSIYGDIVFETEIIAPYITRGSVIGGGYFLSNNTTYNNKYFDVSSAMLLHDSSAATNEKTYAFDGTGENLKRLISHNVPWHMYGKYNNGGCMLQICNGCYVKVEIWVD